MRTSRIVFAVFASAAALVSSVSSPMAQQAAPPMISTPPSPSSIDTTPPHLSTTGQGAERSPEVVRRGAGQPRLCPPGARKKGAKAAAHRC